jgi:hypothetical protein
MIFPRTKAFPEIEKARYYCYYTAFCLYFSLSVTIYYDEFYGSLVVHVFICCRALLRWLKNNCCLFIHTSPISQRNVYCIVCVLFYLTVIVHFCLLWAWSGQTHAYWMCGYCLWLYLFITHCYLVQSSLNVFFDRSIALMVNTWNELVTRE